ncbi:MAG: hypothetical protein WB764_30030 [Xanthobacteraceae bacterium]
MLDTGVEMDLVKLPEPERGAIVERAAAGEKVSARFRRLAEAWALCDFHLAKQKLPREREDHGERLR